MTSKAKYEDKTVQVWQIKRVSSKVFLVQSSLFLSEQQWGDRNWTAGTISNQINQHRQDVFVSAELGSDSGRWLCQLLNLLILREIAQKN